MSAPIVRGMPYATVFYDELTPFITFGDDILSFQFDDSQTRLEVQTASQIWILYLSEQIVLTLQGNSFVAFGPFTGYVRAAGVEIGTPFSTSVLDEHATKIPIGGTIAADVDDDVATMRFIWEFIGNGDLIMMALPHHVDTLTNPLLAHSATALKGNMVTAFGDVWTFLEPLTTLTWNAASPVPEYAIEDIKVALAEDIANTPCCAGDPYFGGKEMAVYARLALIAEELGEEELSAQAREKVKPFAEGWLAGTNGNNLLYDQAWGGIISTNGFNDQQADFGNGMYNDHHYHYGYHIYVAAVLAKADPSWAAEWNDRILHFISDISEPSGACDYYVFSRVKDFYDGHGWASGIFQFDLGKNQESTSESVAAWYAIYLYGLATNNDRVMDLGRLQTALEIRTAWKYWQMTSTESVFPAPFSENKVVGIQWSIKVDYNTWFGSNVEFIHCIQMIPYLPISEELLRPEWIQEEYEVLKEAYNRPEPQLSEGWKGYIIMAHAIIDKEAAFDEALQLTAYDDGNTRSTSLYWISTRPSNGL